MISINIGDKIGPYEIQCLLGGGGMAAVYQVWNSDLHRQEALKIPLSQGQDAEFTSRFLAEARNAAGVHHSHIVSIYSVSSADSPQPFFTMELVNGSDLTALIQERRTLSLEESLPILRQIASALDYAHSHGLVHRDIKPANILLQPDENGFIVKVVDFGISKILNNCDDTCLTRTGMIIGTPEYMSPEQAGNGDVVGYHTDQYSLAVLAYEMLCGKPPFRHGENVSLITVLMKHINEQPLLPSRRNSELSPVLDAVLMKALAKHPAQRYETCGQFIEALAAPSQATISQISEISPKRNFSPVLAMLLIPVLVGGFLIGFELKKDRPLPTLVNNHSGINDPMGFLNTHQPETDEPVQQGEVHFTDATATASKWMKAKGYNYNPEQVLDGRPDTAWNVENTNHGIGEWILIQWPTERTIKKIGIIVGYDKHNYKPNYSGQPQMWFRNNRLRAATLYFSHGQYEDVTFEDKTGLQFKEFLGIRTKWMKLVVRDIYLDMYGGKQKRWDDLAIAEIQAWGDAH